MCEPLSIVAGALSLAGGAAGYAQQSAMANATDKNNKAMAARNQALARQHAAEQYGGLNARITQEQMKAAAEVSSVTTEALQARSRVAASAAESGIAGASLDAMMADFERQEGERLTTIRLNEQFSVDQLESDKRAARMGLESKLLGTTAPIVNRPSLLASGLSAFSSALSSGASMEAALK